MSRTILKPFQDRVVDNACAVLGKCLDELASLRQSIDYTTLRPRLVHDIGSVLIEAPTGIGKTLMAAHTVGRLSAQRPMIWLWFAPFQSVVTQTEGVLLDEVDSLRPRDPYLDRAVEELRSGDVFLATWASVAVNDKDIRKIRRDSEIAPSLDGLIESARLKGWFIGAVIDEAHHTFRGSTKAYAFFKEVLNPDATILITATPKDAEIERFRKSVQLGNLRRITVPRSEGVKAGILKYGIKTAVFRAPPTNESLLDFKRAALGQAVGVHRHLLSLLEAASIPMTPLLLLQIDSSRDTEESARKLLEEFGFRPDQIMVHTANEPDPSLNAVQADEKIQVLVFKMAVALGFDAPRAFTLVSFRSARDDDFGLQIVGRLMRVDRRLQKVADLPEELSYGYVFLSDKDSQTGIMQAGDRINKIKAEFASLETNVTVVTIDGSGADLVGVQGGQPGLPGIVPALGTEDEVGAFGQAGAGAEIKGTSHPYYEKIDLWNGWGFDATPRDLGSLGKSPLPLKNTPVSETNHYALKSGSGFPSALFRAEADVEGYDVIAEILDAFQWDDTIFTLAQTESGTILVEQREIFSGIVEAPLEIRVKLLKKELERRAQLTLFEADRDGFVDRRRLYEGLIKRLASEASHRGLGGYDTAEKLTDALAKILALRPSLLYDAISSVFARHTVERLASPLPKTVDSENSLTTSRLNLYGIYPEDLNTWERPFAELLDNDSSGIVRWWHRNPVRKQWSVHLPIPGHGQFYPDFVVSVEGRTHGNGVILVEIKHQINDPEGNAAAKAAAKHPAYGPVLMLYWNEPSSEWRVVSYDETYNKNVQDRMFRLSMLKTF